MKTSLTHSSKCAGRSLRSIAVMLLAACNLALAGCSGLVSGTSSPANPPPTALDITNVQAASTTTSTSQVVWTTNVAADSAVDYGTSTSYGSSTPVSSAMVTSHQVTLSGLAAGTTYYYQVSSTDSKGNHGKSGGHSVKIAGFSISGTINPATGGSGATLTLGGAANAATTTDSVGNYTFAGQPNVTFTVVTSHAGFTFTPSSQSTTVNGANVSGMNFTANAAPVVPTITTQPGNQTVTAGQTATFTVVAAGTAPLAYQWQKNGASIAGATASSYTTPVTTTSDSGSTFPAVVSNTAGTGTSSTATLTVNPAPGAPTITKQRSEERGSDSEVHSRGGRHGAARLPVAEERSEYRRGHGQQLYDAGDNHFRQRLDVRRGGHEHCGDGNERCSDADGESSTGSANNHYAAGESDGDRGTDSDVHSHGKRDSPAELPVAEKRSEHRGGDGRELYDACNNDFGQRLDAPRGGYEHSGDGNERRSDADGESSTGSANDHHAAGEPDGDRGTDSEGSEERRVGKE